MMINAKKYDGLLTKDMHDIWKVQAL